MFASKKIKTMRDEIDELKNFKDRIEAKEWLENNPNGVIEINYNTKLMSYKRDKMGQGIPLCLCKYGMCSYKIIEFNKLDSADGNKVELIIQYLTYACKKNVYNNYETVCYESKFLIDLQSCSGVETSCKEITFYEFDKNRKEL